MIAVAWLLLQLADPRSPEGFAAAAREASARYADREQAIADGYRRIGGDFPGMGEHWIHSGLAFDGVLDPARPEFLSYVEIDGRPVLLGTAYALPLLPGEAEPDWPAGRDAWHAHTSSIDEETFEGHHAHSGHHATGTARLAMMHAWVWLENPEGMFAADNWALPWLRLGLKRPEGAPVEASRLLALLAPGEDAARTALRSLGQAGLTADTPAVARARAAARAILDRTAGPDLVLADVQALATAWTAMQAELRDRNAERMSP